MKKLATLMMVLLVSTVLAGCGGGKRSGSIPDIRALPPVSQSPPEATIPAPAQSQDGGTNNPSPVTNNPLPGVDGTDDNPPPPPTFIPPLRDDEEDPEFRLSTHEPQDPQDQNISVFQRNYSPPGSSIMAFGNVVMKGTNPYELGVWLRDDDGNRLLEIEFDADSPNADSSSIRYLDISQSNSYATGLTYKGPIVGLDTNGGQFSGRITIQTQAGSPDNADLTLSSFWGSFQGRSDISFNDIPLINTGRFSSGSLGSGEYIYGTVVGTGREGVVGTLQSRSNDIEQSIYTSVRAP